MIKRISKINKYVEDDNIRKLVSSAEHFHNKQYNEIIDTLIHDDEHKRFVCIAGPSSSGKTIFSNKLRQRLSDVGIESFVVSMDNYFRDKDELTLDEAGEYNFEAPDVIDVKLFNDHLEALAKGDKVYMPRYDFSTGIKSIEKSPRQISKKSLIFIEGIHALNYKAVFSHLDVNKIFGIYITPQDLYKTDDGKMVEPHQVRLVRRMIRDTWYRSCNLVSTLKMWDKVRDGEHKYIFPNKDNADYYFNSSLKYELSILRKYFVEEYEKLDVNGKLFCDKYLDKKTLEEFTSVSDEFVPQASILNEFIPDK